MAAVARPETAKRLTLTTLLAAPTIPQTSVVPPTPVFGANVARAQWMLAAHRELREMLEEDAAQAQTKLAEWTRAERQIEEAVVVAKLAHLQKLARGEHSTEPEKPKRKGKGRRS